MFQIDLTASGELLLYLDNRSVEIFATAAGVEYIKKIIQEHRRGLRDQPGYIGTFPTQHAVNKHFANEFLKAKRERVAVEQSAELKGKASKLNIDWDRLEINL